MTRKADLRYTRNMSHGGDPDPIKEARRLVPQTRLADRSRLRNRLDRLKKGKPDSRRAAALLADLQASVEEKKRRLSTVPSPTYNPDLPIVDRKAEIIQAIRDNSVIVLSGETGSGKTTQLPKMCLEAGRGIEGKIGCTQPRRIAALTVAHRIAEEIGGEPGEVVGYKIRFQAKDNPGTFIKVMTDGMLLAEAQGDPRLREYDTIIVDEAHERSLNIDVIIGLLRNLIRNRKDLKVIITSATLDTEKFSAAFDGAPIIEVSGRLYPVDVEYRGEDVEEAGASLPERVDGAISRIIESTGRGDILAFLPTEQDIRETMALATRRWSDRLEVLPLYARLPASQQRQAFKTGGKRKLVVATNVAETSLTIPGIRYVVDGGLARISRYNPGTGTHGLPVDRISRASADQRAGRCGRVEDGVCVRLYTQEDYESREEYTPPEIRRTNLAEVILRMISLGIDDIENFPFVDPPSSAGIRDGLRTLTELHALETTQRGRGKAGRKPRRLTAEGRLMARLPVDPRLARVLLRANEEGCLGDILPIAAALTLPDPRERPQGKEGSADQAHAAFRDPDSDFLGWLNLWDGFRKTAGKGSFSGRLRRYCEQNYLSFRRMKEWTDIHRQLALMMAENGYRPRRSPLGPSRDKKGAFTPRYAAIHRSVLAGYLSHIARKKEKGFYEATRNREARIHPGSGLFQSTPSWIVAAELVRTTRLYARSVAAIDPEWLVDLGDHLAARSWKEARWSRRGGNVIATEQTRLYGFLVSDGKTVPYGEVRPEEAREIFIRSAMVEGDLPNPDAFPFLVENRSLLKRLETMQEKLRRKDLVAGEEALAGFYQSRLPAIFDLGGLNRFLREKGEGTLRMSKEDLLTGRADEKLLDLYPDNLDYGGEKWPLSYRFSPGDESDGATLQVPGGRITEMTPVKTDWMVPGLLDEKVEFLMKGLPKDIRKKLIPMGETIRAALEGIDPEGRDLPRALSEWVYRHRGVTVPPQAWPVGDIPERLKLRYSLVDQEGREIAAGRDPGRLIGKPPAPFLGKGLSALRKENEKPGIKTWPGGDIPVEIDLPGGGKAWPALVPEESVVSLRLLENPDNAAQEHGKGLSRLAFLHWAREIKNFRKELTLTGESRNASQYLGGPQEIEGDLWIRVVSDIFGDPTIRTEEAWEDRLREGGGRIYSTAADYFGQVGSVIDAYRDARLTLTKNRDEGYRKTYIDARLEDLSEIAPRRFVRDISPNRWSSLPRYLRGVVSRTLKGVADPGRDQKIAARFDPLHKRWRTMDDELPPMATQGKREALEEARWLLEELRIALFAAGEIRPATRISDTRFSARLDEIEKML